MSACLIIGVLTKNISKHMVYVGCVTSVPHTMRCFLYNNKNFPSFPPRHATARKEKIIMLCVCTRRRTYSKWKNLIKHVKKKKKLLDFCIYISLFVMTTHVLTLTFSQKLIKQKTENIQEEQPRIHYYQTHRDEIMRIFAMQGMNCFFAFTSLYTIQNTRKTTKKRLNEYVTAIYLIFFFVEGRQYQHQHQTFVMFCFE